MLEKIHCDLLDIFGLDWSQVTPEQVNCTIQAIHNLELIRASDELYGFVGTVDIEDVIGGYFVVQFPTDLLSFSPDKTALTETTNPAETTLFVLFPRVGRLLLQSRHFQILPVTKDFVQDRLKEALAQALRICGVGPVVSLLPTPITVGRTELVEAFDASVRVTRLSVTDPDATQIPEDFPYYNPERDRNAIIRDSRLHDYPELSKVDLTSKQQSDLRKTHLGSDLVHATTDKSRFTMVYIDQHNNTKILRRQRKAKFEFHVDIDGKKLSKEALLQVLAIVSQEASIDIPVRSPSDYGPQLGLFDDIEDEFDEE